MSNLLSSEKFYYQVLKGSRLIFANECNKKKLLDIVLPTCQLQKLKLHVFCVTNNNAHFLISAEQEDEITQCMEQISQMFMQLCKSTIPQIEGVVPALVPEQPLHLEKKEEIKEYMRQIHRLPVDLEYAEKMADYWWSSYIAYMGIYEWEKLHTQELLSYFSKNEAEAIIKFQYFHNRRKRERIKRVNNFEKNS